MTENMNISSNLSEKIRLVRVQKGLSQENMADMMGLSTTAYGDLERGRTEVSVSRLENIARLLDVPLHELLGMQPETLSEVEWLRQENARLTAQNNRLQSEVDQWKSRFAEWFGETLVYETGQQRGRIGF
jgi:XRE family transcriptional regulator, regulator of sulfur utilization